jgi:hypothetical protein
MFASDRLGKFAFIHVIRSFCVTIFGGTKTAPSFALFYASLETTEKRIPVRIIYPDKSSEAVRWLLT